MILCHCDMCRQATGSPLPGFISVAAARVTWSGQPAVYRSSSIAERGFCPTCGTPLFYRADGSDTIGLTAGSARIAFHPTAAYYSAERAPWLHPLDALPERAFAPAKDGVRRTARD